MNWLAPDKWQDDKMSNEKKKFLLSFMEWVREALQHTEIIIVEGNL